MKNVKMMMILLGLITLLSSVASLSGLFYSDVSGDMLHVSVFNEQVQLKGTGLYKKDSVSVAAQGIASDFVTLVLAVPMLVISAYFAFNGSFKGKLALTGTLGYFLYTYMSYTFLWMYNPLFLGYVALMSLSFYAFVLMMTSFDLHSIGAHFKASLPVRYLGGFQIFIGIMLLFLWLGKIIPTISIGDRLSVTAPVGLDHYTTLVIQGMDLGFIVPTAFISGLAILNRKPIGYLLSSVVIFKAITMLTAITAMMINMVLSGVTVSPVEVMVFLAFDLLAAGALIQLLRNVE